MARTAFACEETRASTGTSDPGPGQWVGGWIEQDLCFSSCFLYCLRSLFAGWWVDHRLSLEISGCRLENKPRMPCLLRWMGRIDSDFCCGASHADTVPSAQLLDYGRTGGCTSDRLGSLGRDNRQVWAPSMPPCLDQLVQGPPPAALLTCKRVGRQRIVSAEKS